MEIVLEQKRSLEAEVARAQRTLSRGAVESASRAQGELVLQASVQSMKECLPPRFLWACAFDYGKSRVGRFVASGS